jgi:O-antigen/teichoic acid export membrane protein
MELNKYFKSDFFRNSFLLLSATTIAQIIPIAIYPIVTRLYSPSELGILSVFLSITGILSILATGRYEFAILLPKEEKSALSLFTLAIIISCIFSFLILIIVVVFNSHLILWMHQPGMKYLLYTIPFFLLITGITQAVTYYLNRQKDYKGISTYSLNQSIVNSGSKIVFGFAGLTSVGLILSTFIGQISGTFALIFRLIKKDGINFNKKPDFALVKQEAANYAVFPRFRMIQAFINTLSGSLPVILFASYFSSSISGFFSLGFSLVFRPINLFASSVYQVLSQKVIEKHHHGEPVFGIVYKFITHLALFGCLPFIAILFFAQPLFGFVFGNEWREAGKYLQFLIPWLFLVLLASPLAFTPDVCFKQRKALIIDIIYFIMRIASLFTGIYLKNVYLAIVLYATTSTIIVGYTLFWYLKTIKDWDKEINSKL